MKRFFRRLLFEPITTVEQAKEITKWATFGFYVMGGVGLVSGLLNTIEEVFFHMELPPNENLRIMLIVIFIMTGAFLMNRLASRFLAGLFTLYFICELLFVIFPTVLLGPEFVARWGLGYLWALSILLNAVAILLAIGAIRSTVRFHQLRKEE